MPLFDEIHLRKLSVQPGDVLVLELPESSDALSEAELANIDAKISACFGFDVKVIVVPSGAKLTKHEPIISADQIRAMRGVDPALPGGDRTVMATVEVDRSLPAIPNHYVCESCNVKIFLRTSDPRTCPECGSDYVRKMREGEEAGSGRTFSGRRRIREAAKKYAEETTAEYHPTAIHSDAEAVWTFAEGEQYHPTPGIMPSVQKAAAEGIRDREKAETPLGVAVAGDSDVAALAEASEDNRKINFREFF